MTPNTSKIPILIVISNDFENKYINKEMTITTFRWIMLLLKTGLYEYVSTRINFPFLIITSTKTTKPIDTNIKIINNISIMQTKRLIAIFLFFK